MVSVLPSDHPFRRLETAVHRGRRHLCKWRPPLPAESAFPSLRARPGFTNTANLGTGQTDFKSAADRACDNQKNKCADQANSDKSAGFKVNDCDKQNGTFSSILSCSRRGGTTVFLLPSRHFPPSLCAHIYTYRHV